MLLNEISNLWQESTQDPDFRFELKTQQLSIELASALAKTGMTQKQLAEKLDWKTSRVSKVLHNGTNITLRTLFDICEAMNIDFEVELDGRSQLKQEMEVVKMKNEQLDQMIALHWRKSNKNITNKTNASMLKQTYELVG